jgi:hypothetical protein
MTRAALLCLLLLAPAHAAELLVVDPRGCELIRCSLPASYMPPPAVALVCTAAAPAPPTAVIFGSGFERGECPAPLR